MADFKEIQIGEDGQVYQVKDETARQSTGGGDGTVTAVKMNNGTPIEPDENGVVNLGTVITQHQDVSNKVDKVTGKGLSTNDYTTAEKTKLAGLSNYDDTQIQAAIDALQSAIDALTGVNDTTEAINTMNEVIDFLNGVTNDETLSGKLNELRTLINGKVDSVNGKGLSTNDYTTAEKTKLAGIQFGAEVNPTFATINGSRIDQGGNIQVVGAQGQKGDTGNVVFEDLEDLVALLVNDLTTGGAGNFLSAEMGKRLKAKIEEVNANILRLYNNLGNIAFWDAASKANAAPSELDWGNPKHNVTLSLTLDNAVVTHNGTEKSSGSVIQVEEGAKLTLIVAPAQGHALSGAPTASVGGSAITPTDNGNGTYTIELTMAQSDVTLAISATGAATYSIGYTLTNCTATTRPTSVGAGGSATIVLEADSGYTLPSSLPSGAVTGASVTSWDAATGTLIIGNVTGNVAISLELTDGYITNGLAFHLDGLNKGTNPNAWTDKVGGVVFTNDGATSIAKGWSFDGISGALYNDDSLSFPNSSCTIEVVFKSNGGDSTIALFHQKTDRGIGLGIFPYNGRKLITNICTTQTSGFRSFASNEAHGVFTGVISTHNSKMLINGVEASTDGSSSLSENAKNSVGGRYGTSWVGLFNGEIYDIRIYNRQLSPEEMLQNLAVDNQRYELGLTLNT